VKLSGLVFTAMISSAALGGAATTPQDVAMVRTLAANGPNARLGANAEVFDWLRGSWDLKNDIISEAGEHTSSLGDWHFGWIVNGYMVQDVISFYPPGNPKDRYSGTSLRMYDSSQREWLVVYFAPHPGSESYFTLRGGRVGERIVLNGTDTDSTAIRWSFSDIQRDSFHWTGERSKDGGKTWWLEQEMFAKRRR
jgi:hypothetical protein